MNYQFVLVRSLNQVEIHQILIDEAFVWTNSIRIGSNILKTFFRKHSSKVFARVVIRSRDQLNKRIIRKLKEE